MDDKAKLRLALGRRKSRGNSIRLEWLERISEVLGKIIVETDLLGLEETEFLKEQFFKHVKSGAVRKYYWHQGQEKEVAEILRGLRGRIADKVVLFSDVDFHIGALRVEPDRVLSAPFAVWDVVKEDLSFATPNLEDGLCLELNLRGRQLGGYELSLWGRLD